MNRPHADLHIGIAYRKDAGLETGAPQQTVSSRIS